MTRTLIAAAVGVLALPASADLIVSSLTSTQDVQSLRLDGLNFQAAQFTTDGTAYTLTSAVALIDSATTVNAHLYNDNAGLPGTIVFAFDSTAPTSGFEMATFDAGSFFQLEANTTYHLVLNSPSGTALASLWGTTEIPDHTVTGPGSAEAGRAYSFGLPSWEQFSDSAPLFAINGTPVPAPATGVLMALGGLAMKRRR